MTGKRPSGDNTIKNNYSKSGISQNLVDTEHGQRIAVITVHESRLPGIDLGRIKDIPIIGLSPGYTKSGELAAIAVATDNKCLLVMFNSRSTTRRAPSDGEADIPSSARHRTRGKELLQRNILCRDIGHLYAFDFAPLALSLYFDTDLRVKNSLDVQFALDRAERSIITCVKSALGDEYRVFEENIPGVFNAMIFDPERMNPEVEIVQRAWLAQFLAQNSESAFDAVPKIDTEVRPSEMLTFLARFSRAAFRLNGMQPSVVRHDFHSGRDSQSGQFVANSERFSNRLLRDQDIRLEVAGPGGSYVLHGHTGRVDGRAAQVASSEVLEDRHIISITTIGQGLPTQAERRQAETILHTLQGSNALFDANPWITNIYLSPARMVWPRQWQAQVVSSAAVLNSESLALLNASQISAVHAMLSPASKHNIVLIQGPPGTGKTSVIANFVKLAIDDGKEGIWLVAQSNVAVKNIAEKLTSYGFDAYWLVVSRDFKHDWHDHLYSRIQHRIIQSDELFHFHPRQLQGSQVILCTLSMLSHHLIGRITSCVPTRTLVVDEASQIQIGDYIYVFSKFVKSLRKMCFIGDDKQLAPYGQEELEDLQSIFEIGHLQSQAIFLDTQYRMPPQIGRFISAEVYNGQLQSNSDHPVQDHKLVCYFVDISGKEIFKSKSYQNPDECQAVLKLARQLQDQNKSFRIVVPYEGQRSLIESEMEKHGLEWGDKCFNIDSFQGNEDDYIIISLVRSQGIGFLNNLRRTNVMLTRFRYGMFIVSSKKFLIQGQGAQSLAGRLATWVNEQRGEQVWLKMADLEELRV